MWGDSGGLSGYNYCAVVSLHDSDHDGISVDLSCML